MTAKEIRSIANAVNTPAFEKEYKSVMDKITESSKKGLYFVELDIILSDFVKNKLEVYGFMISDTTDDYSDLIKGLTWVNW